MENHEPNEITLLLQSWRSGDVQSEVKLVEAIYPMLRKLAHAQVRRSSYFTLQATELANEAYIRLIGQKNASWECRGQFFAIAATIIRRIVLDHFRHRASVKAGGSYQFAAIAAESGLEVDKISAYNAQLFPWPLTWRLEKLAYFSAVKLEPVLGRGGTWGTGFIAKLRKSR